MRSWCKTLAVLGLLTVVAPGVAVAQWRDRGGERGGRDGRGGGYAQPYGGYRGAGAYGPSGGGYRAPGGGYGARSYEPAPYGGGGFRRGQVLPMEQRGAYVADPRRYHLRAAPPGYGWVGDGRNAYLTQRSTGMVLDAVPGAYEPPPPYRGRGRRR